MGSITAHRDDLAPPATAADGMDAKLPRSAAAQAPRLHAKASSPQPAATTKQTDWVERTAFWTLVLGLAWAPFWYGSNDLIAWGINAIVFPGLAAIYELSVLVRGRRHPVGIRNIAWPCVLFAVVVLWIFLQMASWSRGFPAHPVWAMAGEALGLPLAGSISVNRDLTMLALVRLITVASAFWIALQLCRDAGNARRLIAAIAAIGCLYAGYGLIAFALQAGRLPWLEASSREGFVTATFVNHNSFATYAGLALMAMCGLVLREYRHRLLGTEGHRGLTIAALIESTGQAGAALVAGGFVLVVAILLTGSRGGGIASAFGLFVLCFLTLARPEKQAAKPLAPTLLALVLVAGATFAFGDVLIGTMAERGLDDSNRASVYLITLRSIFDAPLTGFGYGTFADVFPMYRDRSVSVQGAWQQAHDTYLEVFQGLGLVFGFMLVAAVVLLVLRCARGAVTRQENATVPRVAVGMACLVGIHSLVDFSLQIQAVALTFAAALGAGVAQSESSRLALED